MSRRKALRGEIKIHGDKSISHRAAILASMAEGVSRIENFSPGADCASTVSCLRQLGVEIETEGTTLIVHGVGRRCFRKPEQPLDCGNSGTTMRLLAGVLVGQNFDSVLTGDKSLSRRPMKRVIEPLSLMNAEIKSNDGRPPLEIFGISPLQAIEYTPPLASAQVKSALLLAGLHANGTTSILEKIPTRDHAERLLRWLEADLEERETVEGTIISVSGNSILKPRTIDVPGDISSAAYFIAAAAFLPGSEILLKDVGVNPTRTAFLDLLQQIGAEMEIFNEKEACNEPVADIHVRAAGGQPASNRLTACRTLIPQMIDELPLLAVIGTLIDGGITIRDAAELRVKESDRIASIVKNLRAMGAAVEEFPDGFRVERSNLKGAQIDSFGDHRIAMGFAIAGLFAEGKTEIAGKECVDVSFPGFFEILERNESEPPGQTAEACTYLLPGELDSFIL